MLRRNTPVIFGSSMSALSDRRKRAAAGCSPRPAGATPSGAVTEPHKFAIIRGMEPITSIDRYEPDYAHSCEVCGGTPVVSGVKDGKTVYVATMCGPCLWNEPSAADPATWNEGSGA
jgi:hypothetical protein